jgi:MFS family permease
VSKSAVVAASTRPDRAAGRPQRAATFATFISHGLLFASWAAHIPHVKAHLGLTDADLGLALLGAPVGSVLAMLACTRLLPRLGSRRMVQISLLGYCAAGPLVGIAGSLPLLFGALFCWGAFQGTLDVSMNTQAVAVERAEGRPLMPGFHASWSIGAFAGAGIGAAGVALGISLTQQLLLLAVPVLAICGPLTLRMLSDADRARATGSARETGVDRPAGTAREPARTRGAGSAREQARTSGTGTASEPGRPRETDTAGDAPAIPHSGRRAAGRLALRVPVPVLILGAIAFASMLCEGASADWGSVYLHGSLGASAAVAGLAYTAFSLTMVVVRLSGNRLLARFRPYRLLPALAALAAAGFTAGLIIGGIAATIAGFGCLGIGLALVVPSVNSASGRLPGRSPGAAIAMVSSFGWAGFVFGPPIIGELASATSLATALAVLPVLVACIVVATARARALRPAA